MERKSDRKVKYLTQEETKDLFKAIISLDSTHAVRDLAIFRVAYRCGLRASEIGLIKLEDYNASKGVLYCKRLKGSYNNTIRLDTKTKNALDKYIHESKLSSNSEFLFKSQRGKPISRQTLDYMMKKYCSYANIYDKSKYHFHSIKHTTAVHLAESDMDIKELQWWLGHKYRNLLSIYNKTARKNVF